MRFSLFGITVSIYTKKTVHSAGYQYFLERLRDARDKDWKAKRKSAGNATSEAIRFIRETVEGQCDTGDSITLDIGKWKGK